MLMTSCFGGSTPILGRKRITLLQPYLARCECHVTVEIAASTGSEENTSAMSGNGPANRVKIYEIAASTGSEENTSAMSGNGPTNRVRSFIHVSHVTAEIAVSTGSEESMSVMSGNGPVNRGRIGLDCCEYWE